MDTYRCGNFWTSSECNINAQQCRSVHHKSRVSKGLPSTATINATIQAVIFEECSSNPFVGKYWIQINCAMECVNVKIKNFIF